MEYKMKAAVDTPESLTKAITGVGHPLSQIYRHILFWYRPEFEVPLGSQYARLRSYDVQGEVEAFTFGVPPLDVEETMIREGKTRDEVMADYTKAKRNASLKALNLERELIRIIMDRKDVFDVAANTKVSLRSSAIVNGHHCNKHRPHGCSMRWVWLMSPYLSTSGSRT